MVADDEVTEEYRSRLLGAVEDSVALDVDWAMFHARLAEAAAGRLTGRRWTARGHRDAAAPGDAWWDYAARIGLTAVPLGLAAALFMLAFLRSGSREPSGAVQAVQPSAVASTGEDSARVAFVSVFTGAAAPRAVMATLIPVRSAVFIADGAGRSIR